MRVSGIFLSWGFVGISGWLSSYHSPFVGDEIWGLGFHNHKVGCPRKEVWSESEPTAKG